MRECGIGMDCPVLLIWGGGNPAWVGASAGHIKKAWRNLSNLKCLTRTNQKTSHSTCTLNIKMRVICLYISYNQLKVHAVWLVFLKFELNNLVWEISSRLLRPIRAAFTLVVGDRDICVCVQRCVVCCSKLVTSSSIKIDWLIDFSFSLIYYGNI